MQEILIYLYIFDLQNFHKCNDFYANVLGKLKQLYQGIQFSKTVNNFHILKSLSIIETPNFEIGEVDKFASYFLYKNSPL